MRKFYRIMFICLMLVVMSTTAFAVTFEPTSTVITNESGDTYMIRTYTVSEADNELFKTGIIQKFSDGGHSYSLDSIKQTGGNIVLNKEETQIKIVETNTDDSIEILKQLPVTINYEEDGYVGELKLNNNSILTNKVSNGTYTKQYTVSEDVNFSNFTPNDLYDVPKTKVKNGVTMKLLNVDWKVQTSEYVAGSQVPIYYSGIAHYAGIGTRVIESTAKYSTSAEYKGNITKEETYPITYIIKYKQDSTGLIVGIFVAILTTCLLALVMFFIFRKNVKIYNAKNDEYVLINKKNINYSNPVINLSNLAQKSMSNMYKIILSKSATKKLYGTKIKVVGNNKTINHLVNAYDTEYSFEVII